jgi:sulfite reductase alpha subunit-like flavoprotein
MKVDQDSTDEYEREDAEGCDVSTDTGRVVLDVSIKPAGDFRLPIDPTIPLIFVCAGSGIAPFRYVMVSWFVAWTTTKVKPA